MLNPVWKCAQLARRVLQHEIGEIKLKKRSDLDGIVMSEMHARRAVAHIVLQKDAARHARFQNTNKEKAVASLANVKIELQKRMPMPMSDEPKTIFEALASENAHEWAQRLIKDDGKLDTLNVFLHDQTEEQLKKLGIAGNFIIQPRYVVSHHKEKGWHHFRTESSKKNPRAQACDSKWNSSRWVFHTNANIRSFKNCASICNRSWTCAMRF
jgi:hypothetical protein